MIDRDMNCIQGAAFNNMYQAAMPVNWPFPQNPIKQEPMEDKNDSGITSGSDFHSSSSPGSEHSAPYSPHPQAARFFSPPIHPMALYNHPLTPPISEPLISPKLEEKEHDATLTPCASPARKPDDDHLRRLELSLEKSGLFSSKMSEGEEEGSGKSDDEFDEQGVKVARVNSHGKVKTFKCKQCEFVAVSKLEYWDHTKSHIREEKRLQCPKCPFITEYKHHLEYHLRNHSGSKPFKCNKCEYSCVNKSMLNSHMKSHSNIYRYSCRDCSYATKYCHSLKIHLRRYQHTPNVVLDEDGNPCPDLIIDVHGTRRGPKIKHLQARQQLQAQMEGQEEEPKEVAPFLNFSQNQLPFGYPFFPNPQILQNFQQLIRERQALAASTSPDIDSEKEDVLDLSKPVEQKSRRKGPAFKLEAMNADESDGEEESDEEDDLTTTMFSNVEVVQSEEEKKVVEEVQNNNKGEDNTCQYCSINFGDAVLYTMHMGYHGFKNPFNCNMCGVECSDKVGFFLHIARTPHT